MKTKKKIIQVQYVNGYKILFVPGPSNTLYVQSVIHSGFINETKHTAGLNHLLEHVLVDGWKKCKGSCITYWDNLGKYINASTDITNMKYYVKGGVENTNEMIQYISMITTNPTFHTITLTTEKKAIVEELKSSSNDLGYELIDQFNKLFFKEDGLRYADDWQLQIKNLTHLTLSDIKHLYHKYFNSQNVMFVVYGDFNKQHVVSLLSTHLVPHQGIIEPYDCFTYQPTFSYVHHSKESYTVLIGFPCKQIFDFKDLCEDIINTLLFHELRTIHKLVYGVKCYFNNTRCNTYVCIEFDVSLEKVKNTIQHTIHCLLHYKKYIIPSIILNSCKKRILYKYRTSYDMMDYYSEFIYLKTPLTKQQLIKNMNTFNVNHFKNIMNEAIDFDTATCVYQGKHNLHLTWNTFNLNDS